MTKITQLSLYDNNILKMEGFESLVNLRKLYLERNCISKLEGLHNCRQLEELNLGHQTLAGDRAFEFDEYSVVAIARTLS